MYKLNELIFPWISNYPINTVLTGLTSDSRNVVEGDLFIALKGGTTDGRIYIDHAIKNGAVAILSESYNNDVLSKNFSNIQSIPIIYFNNLVKKLSEISGRFYDHPSLFINLIGVTGTNGKTTITHLLSNWVQLLGKKSAVMGTLGNGMLYNKQPSYYTTPSSINIQKILAQWIKNKIGFVAMEVSSHGLDQYRVDGLYFDVAIFSNLSHEHLDYHNNMQEYSRSKWRLFNELYVDKYVINVDDYIGKKWLSSLSNSVAVTMKDNLPNEWIGKWICLIKAHYYVSGTDIIFNSSWGRGIIHSQLLGDFNVSNILLALAALLVIGYPLQWLLNTASQLKPVYGRVEVFQSCNKPIVIVDYAHTPDALEKILNFSRKLCKGQLWCIFGCGGNRDRKKRAFMGIIAEKYSDRIIITNDNPRTERSECIINDIICKIKFSKKIKIIQNRANAIKTAILQAYPEDCILILGKGHEKHQIIGHDYIDFSDQNEVKKNLYYDSI